MFGRPITHGSSRQGAFQLWNAVQQQHAQARQVFDQGEAHRESIDERIRQSDDGRRVVSSLGLVAQQRVFDVIVRPALLVEGKPQPLNGP